MEGGRKEGKKDERKGKKMLSKMPMGIPWWSRG